MLHECMRHFLVNQKIVYFLTVLFQFLLVHLSEPLEEALLPWGPGSVPFPMTSSSFSLQRCAAMGFSHVNTGWALALGGLALKDGKRDMLVLRFMWENQQTLFHNLFLCGCRGGDAPSPHISQGHSVLLLPRCSIAVWRLRPRPWTLEKGMASWCCTPLLLFQYINLLSLWLCLHRRGEGECSFRLTSLSYEEQISLHFILPEDYLYHQETLGALPCFACLCPCWSLWMENPFLSGNAYVFKYHLPDEHFPTLTTTNI